MVSWEFQLSSSAQQNFFLAQLSKKFSTAQLSSAQLFFSKFATLVQLAQKILTHLLKISSAFLVFLAVTVLLQSD